MAAKALAAPPPGGNRLPPLSILPHSIHAFSTNCRQTMSGDGASQEMLKQQQ